MYTVNNAMAQAGIHIQIPGDRVFRSIQHEPSYPTMHWGKETVTALKPFKIAILCFPVQLFWIHILAELLHFALDINKLSRSNHAYAEVIYTLNLAYGQQSPVLKRLKIVSAYAHDTSTC